LYLKDELAYREYIFIKWACHGGFPKDISTKRCPRSVRATELKNVHKTTALTKITPFELVADVIEILIELPCSSRNSWLLEMSGIIGETKVTMSGCFRPFILRALPPI
jgi:hypothetical protein